nr:MAG TPA: PROTEIN ANTIBIOTIC [Bacteriophage sp.]
MQSICTIYLWIWKWLWMWKHYNNLSINLFRNSDYRELQKPFS